MREGGHDGDRDEARNDRSPKTGESTHDGFACHAAVGEGVRPSVASLQQGSERGAFMAENSGHRLPTGIAHTFIAAAARTRSTWAIQVGGRSRSGTGQLNVTAGSGADTTGEYRALPAPTRSAPPLSPPTCIQLISTGLTKTLATATVNQLLDGAPIRQTSGASVRLTQALTGRGEPATATSRPAVVQIFR